MNYLSNAVSLNMFKVGAGIQLTIQPCSPGDVPQNVVSIIGHQDTAKAASLILKRPIPYNRAPVQLSKTDTLYIIQYIGSRLPEGTTQLPSSAEFKIYKISFT